jgi:amino acid transporter
LAAIYLEISRPRCFFFIILTLATMSFQPENPDLSEKHAKHEPDTLGGGHYNGDPELAENMVGVVHTNALRQDLKGRHMQMIAMQVSALWTVICLLTCVYSGGAIGAGLFVSSGGAFQTGGPGSVVIGFMIIGTLYALWELRRGN